jgi:hypothetical protein
MLNYVPTTYGGIYTIHREEGEGDIYMVPHDFLIERGYSHRMAMYVKDFAHYTIRIQPNSTYLGLILYVVEYKEDGYKGFTFYKKGTIEAIIDIENIAKRFYIC